MRQLVGTMLVGCVLIYAIARDKIVSSSAKLMNDALNEDRRKKLSARRNGR